MKPRLLYIGNKLTHTTSNVTTIELLGSLLEREGYKISYASSKKNQIIRLLDMIFAVVMAKMKGVKYVLIDTYSTSGFYFAWIVSQLCRILKLKYIPILHGGNLPNRLQKSPTLSDTIFKYAYKNVAPSNYLYEVFFNKYPTNTVKVPNPIEVNNYSFVNRTLFEPKLLWVRALDEIYNPKMALEVIQILTQKFPQASLTMVGPDKENRKQELEQIAKSKNLNVTFTGKLSKAAWLELSKSHSIFINTTRVDNTPMSVLEAMLLGLPVVSTNVGGIRHLIENNIDGFLVPDNDAKKMAECIDILIHNPILANLCVTNARNKIERLDWNVVKKSWNDLLF
jgi:glycosyltransferase involved in cell wall biosynthesis